MPHKGPYGRSSKGVGSTTQVRSQGQGEGLWAGAFIGNQGGVLLMFECHLVRVRGGKGELVSGTNLVAMGNLVAWAGCLQSVYGEC